MPSRDFDGGLLRRWTFILTRDDALAYLDLPRPVPRHTKVLQMVWFVAGGACTGMLPENLTGPANTPSFIAVLLTVLAAQFVLLRAVRAVWRLWQAQQRVPNPRPAVFEEWIDCVAGASLDDSNEIYLSPELIGDVIETPTHIFILSGQNVITLPKRVLEDPAEMVVYLRRLAKGPYYFDA